VAPEVIELAIRDLLRRVADGSVGEGFPRVFVQDRSMWQPSAGEPFWAWFGQLLPRRSIELVTVGRSAGGALVATTIGLPARHGHAAGDGPAATFAQIRQQKVLAVLQSSVEDVRRRWDAEFAPYAGSPQIAATPEELYILDEILSGLARGGAPVPVQYRIAAMFYFFPAELPAQRDLPGIPEWANQKTGLPGGG
jgi:hypothetical protein